ncbi:hypothetical protein OPV22_016470 [Ensete ventricosum]|uniref:PH domain-containing protein n=1 Tax=Ensete ventricosum TaxID=4639 RepID=A0AAV8PEB1_ENSVE|nr:hypothetical protein OPV22_016470 [Ensete ventricosum]
MDGWMDGWWEPPLGLQPTQSLTTKTIYGSTARNFWEYHSGRARLPGKSPQWWAQLQAGGATVYLQRGEDSREDDGDTKTPNPREVTGKRYILQSFTLNFYVMIVTEARFCKASEHSPQTTNSRADYKLRSLSHSWAVRRVMGAASLLNLFSLSRLPWGSRDDNEKIELTRAEVESLRSEIADAEERETYLKAQLEHLDGILRSAWLCGYLYVRTRWTQLPGEPPIIDDDDIDDWLPRFVVLHGSCIYYYLKSTDLSPQDSTLLSDVVEVGPLPSFKHGDEEIRHAFYLLTCQGLRFECSSISEVQVESWLTTLQSDCKLKTGSTVQDSSKS